jgi:outer membrane biosynthesis protein TonB
VLAVADGDLLAPIGLLPTADMRMRHMAGGFVASVILHVLVVLLVVFGWPWLKQAPPPEQVLVIPVNLVVFGEKTASPAPAQVATLPQEQARETSTVNHPEAVPVEQATPPPDVQHKTVDRSTSDPLTATKSEQPSQTPKRVKGPKDPAPPATKQPRPKVPADDLNARLKQLAQLKQPAPPVPPSPRQQDGSGTSNVTATAADAARARDTTYSVKDFIRAQVERRWNPDRKAIKAGWTVAIHIVLDPDGAVTRADIVNEERHRSDKAYMDFARSARNAVRLSSPLSLPPGAYEIAKDIVIDFDPRQVLQ